MKKGFILILITSIMLTISGCKTEEVILESHHCKETPFKDDCLQKIKGPVYDDSVKYGTKSEFNETFSEDMVDSQPFSWLLYRSDTYKIGGVEAKVKIDDQNNKYVALYSNGLHGPLYNPLDRSLIFTRQFNLDELGYGFAEAEILIPSERNNEVYFEVTTGAVNVLGINVKKDGKLTVISGGVFHNYQGTIDVTNPNITLTKDKWYKFRLEWNRDQDLVRAYMYDNNQLIKLHESKFHISVRESAKKDGKPVVPNIVRFSMPKLVDRDGYIYIDNIRVTSESEE